MATPGAANGGLKRPADSRAATTKRHKPEEREGRDGREEREGRQGREERDGRDGRDSV